MYSNSPLKILIFFLIILNLSCYKDSDDQIVPNNLEINDFVWKGLNAVYYYKGNVNDLANNRFVNDTDYTNFLQNFNTPEQLFEELIYNRESIDRFSWITDDYFAFEQQLNGIDQNTGAEFNFYYKPGNSTEIYGVVRLILPNSNASNSTLKRGDIFDKINGEILNLDNINMLLSNNTYEINLAEYNDNGTTDLSDDTIVSSSETISLTKSLYTENPIFKYNIIELNGVTVGYIMYNAFLSDYTNELNAVFQNFKTSNVQQLILDLRYNGGGSIQTATELGSMITGQFQNQIFTNLIYNNDLQNLNSTYSFSTNLGNGDSVESLGLNELYVITSNRTASASEMIINSLGAYIDVHQIGLTTTGKSQASVTIYDSPNLGRSGANPNHSYAMQPIVANTFNKNNQSVPNTGIVPSFSIGENPANYGTIGAVNEPLLAAALSAIEGDSKTTQSQTTPAVLDSDSFKTFNSDMYVER